MNNGWIKLHRKILDNPISDRPLWFSVWVHILLLANHDEEHSFIWNNKKIVLSPGQFVTGRKQMAKLCGVSESLIERVMKWLENEHQIEQQKTTKYRLITVLKWKDYQKSDNETDSKKTTKEQQKDTFKNVRSKEDKNKTYSAEGAEVIKALEIVDPKNKTYYGNTTQRKAADFLVSEYSLEKVLKVIALLPKTNNIEYCPNITSPYDLKEKWGKLAAALQRIKNNQPIIL